MQKKILVTGGTGFIGSRLVHKLATGGDEIRVLVRPSSSLVPLSGLDGRIVPVQGDVTDYASLQQAMQGVDEVYHSAGFTYMGGDPSRDKKLRAINIDGTRNVLKAAREAGVRRVLHVSSITAVGVSGKGKPADETFSWNFHKVPLSYAETKHLAEEAVMQAVGDGLDCVIVNPAFVFGAGDVNFNAGRLIKDVYQGRVPAYPLGGICVIDVEIVVETTIAAMQKGRTGERYIIGGDNVTYRQLSQTIARVTGVKPFMVPVPFSLARFILSVFSMLGYRHRFSKLFNLSMFRVASEFLYFDSSKARRELGMRSEPHEESIRRAFEWYRKEGML